MPMLYRPAQDTPHQWHYGTHTHTHQKQCSPWEGSQSNRIPLARIRIYPPSQGCFPVFCWRESPRGDFPPFGGLTPSEHDTYGGGREGEKMERDIPLLPSSKAWYVHTHCVRCIRSDGKAGDGGKNVPLRHDM